MSDRDGNCDNNDSCSFGISCDGSGCSTGRRALIGTLAGGGLTALSGCVGLFGVPEAPTTPTVGMDESFDISWLEQDERITVGGDQKLLEAAEAQGWDLPYFCRTGFCGVCLARVDGNGHDLVDMTINEFDPLDEKAIEDGYVLTCTGYPIDDFAIQTGVAGALTEEEEPPDDEEDVDENDDEPRAVRTYAIDYVKQQWTIEVPEDRSLLVAGEDRDFDLPYQCREGWCGRCLAQIDGDTGELIELAVNDYDPLDDDAMSQGYTLTCQGFPRGEFAMETGKFQEEDWPSGSPP